MLKILLSGCCGKMGQAVAKCVSERQGCTIVAGADTNLNGHAAFPIFSSPADCAVANPDVIIDFSHPNALDGVLSFAVAHSIPTVIATTGLSSSQKEQIADAAKKIPVFFTANMSMGVNLMCELAKKAAQILYPAFDVEIVEQHHNRKIDAPSGTALMLADEISSVLPEPPEYVFDRHAKREARSQKEIGIHSVRGGTIPGEHEVIFAGPQEVFSLKHSAFGKEVFANGSIQAAQFIIGQPAGLYSMKDLV